jgi:hypothetical protein
LSLECLAWTAYLNLQYVIATDALVVHLMVGIISITTVLVLNKSETTAMSAQLHAKSRVEHTYSREDVDRGAGISQRTSRP